MIEMLKKSYNKTATSYDLVFREKQFAKYSIIKKDFFPGNSLFLDLGCGTALLYEYVKKNFGLQIAEKYRGVDFSDRMLQQGRQKGAEVSQGDLRNLPLKDGTFSLVFSFTSMRIIPSPVDEIKMLHEVFRILNPMGVFVITILKHNYDNTFLDHLSESGFIIEEKEIPCGQDLGFVAFKKSFSPE